MNDINNKRLLEREEYNKLSYKMEDYKLFTKNRRNVLLNKKSKAESKFKKLLNDANIKFIREKPHMLSGKLYYTDFYIENMKLNIEIDGEEHLLNLDYDLNKEESIYIADGSLTLRYTNSEVFQMDSINYEIIERDLINKYKLTSDRRIYKWLSNKEKAINFKKYKNEIVSDVKDIFNQYDIVVKVRGGYSSLKDFSDTKISFKIYDNGELLEDMNIVENHHQFISNNKSELLSIVRSLEYLARQDALDLNICICSNNLFIIKKLSDDERFKYDEMSIYADCMPDVNRLIDAFSSLTFKWVPKEGNIYFK